ncbi:unnamed protein product [Mytilus coruscus]|uniref:Uncharacterized protein n=1 Tax=Mytilus coruscus TaxID=42192 RepID=A0A6J8E8H3_MYTCO|nr:unnamed protein product [Mytilus coruscus]
MILTSKSCPANNITLERLMAQIDRQKTIAPNTSISTINSKLMFKNNGTADWLREKTEEQKNTIIVKCRQMGEEKKQRDIRDFIKIYNEKSTIIEARIEEKELKEAKMQAEKEKIILEINNLGGKWTKLNQIYSFISTCKTKKLKINAIKAQLTYRKEVEIQKVDTNSKHLFKKSLDLPELTENLKKINTAGTIFF